MGRVVREYIVNLLMSSFIIGEKSSVSQENGVKRELVYTNKYRYRIDR